MTERSVLAQDADKGTTYHRYVSQLAVDLAERPRRAISIDGYRRAAVALLLRDEGDAIQVPFIVRPTTMRAHSGQIALPGGTVDPEDPTEAACARRETFEELGIEPERIAVLGLLDDVPTPTGYVITPVVGRLHGSAGYQPNPAEVAEVFEAPLGAFADRSAAEDLGEREHRGIRYRLRAYRIGRHRIWGATARILESLIEASPYRL